MINEDYYSDQDWYPLIIVLFINLLIVCFEVYSSQF